MSATRVALLEALELPLNMPGHFWLGFVFTESYAIAAEVTSTVEELARGRGRGFRAVAASSAQEVAGSVEAVLSRTETDVVEVLDWSRLRPFETEEEASRGLAAMTEGRDRLARTLRGGLLALMPQWLEPHCHAAVDLWSIREFVLRLAPEFSASEHAVRHEPPIEGLGLWRRLAPIPVMRALREQGVAGARATAADLLTVASDEARRQRLEVVAAGLALAAGERNEAQRAAEAALSEAEVAPDVEEAALDIAATARPVHEAVPQWRALSDRLRERRGAEDPSTLAATSRLAGALHAQGDAAAARRLQERVLAVRRRDLGERHPATLATMGNLAEHVRAEGRLTEARRLQERVLEETRQLVGEDHPDTLTAMGNLGGTLWAEGSLRQAARLEERVLEARRRVLGNQDPQTLMSMSNLAATYRALGAVHEARALDEESVRGHRRAFGDTALSTLRAEANLAETLVAEGDTAGARAAQQRVLTAARRAYGAEQPETLASMGNLGITLWMLGEFSEARSLQEQALAGCGCTEATIPRP